MMGEDAIRAAHRVTQDGVVGGHGGICRCSCGARWRDEDLDCPALEAALEAALDALDYARLDDDGGPAR